MSMQTAIEPRNSAQAPPCHRGRRDLARLHTSLHEAAVSETASRDFSRAGRSLASERLKREPNLTPTPPNLSFPLHLL